MADDRWPRCEARGAVKLKPCSSAWSRIRTISFGLKSSTALEGVELILHAGDVGGPSVIAELGAIAPVRAVFGNTDVPGEPGLAESLDLEIDGVSIHVSHGHEVGGPTPEKLLSALLRRRHRLRPYS